MNITKTLQGIVALNMNTWYTSDETRKKLDKLPLKIQWTVRKNMKDFITATNEFNAFKEELIQKRNNKWFVEGNGKCEKYIQKDENNKEVEMLRIIPEYMEEYLEYEHEINKSLQEILLEENNYTFTKIDLDTIVDASDEKDAGITMDDLDMLSIFSEDEGSE